MNVAHGTDDPVLERHLTRRTFDDGYFAGRAAGKVGRVLR